MATHIITPETRYTPQEAISTAPVRCATCNTQWDRDEEEDMYDLIDGRAYCSDALGGSSCAHRAYAKAYRRAAAQLVNEKINETLEALADLAQEYPNGIDDHGQPHVMLADVRDRLRAFVDGKDNGWRNGLMLDDDEAWSLRYVLRATLGLGPFTPIPPAGATIILRPSDLTVNSLRNTLVKIESANTRTQDGRQ